MNTVRRVRLSLQTMTAGSCQGSIYIRVTMLKRPRSPNGQGIGLEFLNECYEAEHTVSLNDAIEDLTEVCRGNGGNIQ